MKKKLLLLLLLTQIQLYAVFIGTGAHYPDGYYLVNTLTNYSSKVLTDSKGETQLDNLDLSYTQFVTQPFYYQGNFVYFATIPLVKKKIGLFDSSQYGIADSYLAAGYFLPFDSINIVPVMQIKLPLGKFNKNENNNIGTGTYSLHPEVYINKTFSKFMLDVAIKYTINFQNNETNIKEGNKVNLEAVLAYIHSSKFIFGPSIFYTKYENQEVNGDSIEGTQKMNLLVGADLLYNVDDNIKLIFNVMKDVQTKNSTRGVSSSLLFIYSF